LLPAVILHGYAASAPRVAVEAGTAGQIQFDAKTKYFTVEVKADLSIAAHNTGGDAVRRVPVRLETN